MLYTLSTCIWCRKTKALLSELNLEYDFLDMDLLSEEDQEEAYTEMESYNPHLSFPTIVINRGEQVIKGFEEEMIRHLGHKND
ncbi:MAG: Glutaredoxin [Parcubacteria group bacterium GW2011_GWA2_42_28]|nr:MAG: Glutaredoxin [Parcubacteria group bacterium GW2011_GWA2_42_28]KKT52156.1 MAG: Glutaredoxin [Parcubacteria group bacterium GW2011_GWC2_44_22]